MDERENQRRERAYRIWEEEGHPDGLHGEHWNRAEDRIDLTEQESEDVTRVRKPIWLPRAIKSK
jgi:hypothetical protein